MLYKNDFVAVVKNNGKILRENGSTVYLPFDSEYSIYMKNLRARKAKVRIWIDGQDVLNGSSLIIDGNSDLELERFLENMDMNKGNKFRFIQKTEKIQEHRGDKIDDGILRIEFQYEREVIQTPIQTTIWNGPYYYHSYDHDYTGIKKRGLPRGTGAGNWTGNSDISSTFIANCNTTHCSNSNVSLDSLGEAKRALVPQSAKPLNDEGITVKGSESNQKFKYGNIGWLEDEKHVITLQLKGETSTGTVVVEPVTVKTKLICPTCGTKNDSKGKFCTECGTALK